ncbi:MAG: PAS domain S-box protein, partial [Gemmatimonadetes bacterium]|nr:PAS domain S-box protein [Gemmatimonadota bacterium]
VTVLGDEVLLADGRILERDYIPVRDGDDFLGHLWQYRDVTEARRAEQEVARAERHRRAVLDASLDAIFVLDEEGGIRETNPAASRALGWPQEEIRSRAFAEIVLSADASPGMRRDSARRCDGSVFPCEISVTEIPEEEPRRFVAVIHELGGGLPA